jgi:hypothetical protein
VFDITDEDSFQKVWPRKGREKKKGKDRANSEMSPFIGSEVGQRAPKDAWSRYSHFDCRKQS